METIQTDRAFHRVKSLVETRYNSLVKSGATLFQVDVDKYELWQAYHSAFAPELQQEHQCSACRNFIKSVGGLVVITEDLELNTLWDHRGASDVPSEYLKPLDSIDSYVRSRAIEGLFRHTEPVAGCDRNHDKTRNVVWQHFHARIPSAAFNKGNCVGQQSAALRDSKNVLLRSVIELTVEAVRTVQELIDQGSLYRGNEYKAVVDSLRAAQEEFAEVQDGFRDRWAWLKAIALGPALSRARNTAIGQLLIDLSNDVDMEAAVASYERIMAPTNYKRPKALVTPRMLEQAKETLKSLDLMSALDRRRLDTRDLTADRAIFTYRPQKSQRNIFEQIADDIPANLRELSKVEEVGIEKFIESILPTAKSVRVLFERSHLGNLVTLTGPQDPEAKSLMKWDNSFAWSYCGGVADAIKEKVKKAGGRVDNVWLRASLSWSNYDDLDLHFVSQREHVYYSNKRGTQAMLDVDMNAGHGQTREPVENIFVEKRLPAGRYQVGVKQFNRRERNDCGFDLEIEVNGEVFHFGSPTSPEQSTTLLVNFNVNTDGSVTFDKTPWATTAANGMTKWGLKTGLWHPVRAVTLSPNHWTRPIGNKHWFFLLEGCVSDENTRPFYNEFLCDVLAKDRKVCEVLASKIEVAPAEGAELSGLGFSDTQRGHLFVEVEGSFKRTIKVLF